MGKAPGPPKWIKPQLSRVVDEAPAGKDWLHEIKYDRLWPRRYSASVGDGHPGSPDCASFTRQNGHAERLIGSIRRECLDHIVILGEEHLRRVLKAYAAYRRECLDQVLILREAHLCQILRAYANYYNRIRTHLSLEGDAPLGRPVRAIRSLA